MAKNAVTPMTTKAVAKDMDIPPSYLAKILRALATADIVVSKRGVRGGFHLARTPANISLLEIVNAVDPLERIHDCPLKVATHCEQLCPLHRRLDDAISLVEQALARTSLAEIVREAEAEAAPAPHEEFG